MSATEPNVQWFGRGESPDQAKTEHRLQYNKEGVRGQVWLRAVDADSVYEPRYLTSAVARSLPHFSLGVITRLLAMVTSGTSFAEWGLAVVFCLVLGNVLYGIWLMGSGSATKRIRAMVRVSLTLLGYAAPLALWEIPDA
jgi:hypothetical protein